MLNRYSIANAAGRLLPAALLLCCALCQNANAGGVTFTLDRQINPTEYAPGESVFVLLTITHNPATGVNSIGVEESIPPGWVYGGYVSGTLPCVQPAVGTSGNNGLLEFAWFALGECTLPLPVFSFSYELVPASGSVGTVAISGRAIARVNEQDSATSQLETDIVREGSGTPHRADPNQNFIVSLSELLRVVQFFARGGYRCRPINLGFGEDGFVAGTLGQQNCTPHDSDFMGEPDFAISLAELLRLVQLYNAGTYHSCDAPESDDGFCPGPPN